MLPVAESQEVYEVGFGDSVHFPSVTVHPYLSGWYCPQKKNKLRIKKHEMAIFGLNGLKFLALDFAVIFALYGMKQVNLTKEEVKAVTKFAFRKSIKGQTKEEKKRSVAASRAAALKQMSSTERYKDTDADFAKAYGKKEWLR